MTCLELGLLFGRNRTNFLKRPKNGSMLPLSAVVLAGFDRGMQAFLGHRQPEVKFALIACRKRADLKGDGYAFATRGTIFCNRNAYLFVAGGFLNCFLRFF